MCSSHILRTALAGATPPPPVAELGPDVRLADAGGAPFRRVADLTHVLAPGFPVFPFYQPWAMRALARVENEGFSANELCMTEHVGTHIDAPCHFFADGVCVDALDASRLVAPLVVISIAGRAEGDHDAMLLADDVRAWERAHGRIPRGAVVAMHSGWESRIGDAARFLNADASGVMHHPGVSGEAAELLVHERGVAGVAVDTISLDFGASSTYDAHRTILGGGCFGLENVAHLDQVPPAGATLVVGAPKHQGGTGGPTRLLALF
jgi:kynurenine formamidase